MRSDAFPWPYTLIYSPLSKLGGLGPDLHFAWTALTMCQLYVVSSEPMEHCGDKLAMHMCKCQSNVLYTTAVGDWMHCDRTRPLGHRSDTSTRSHTQRTSTTCTLPRRYVGTRRGFILITNTSARGTRRPIWGQNRGDASHAPFTGKEWVANGWMDTADSDIQESENPWADLVTDDDSESVAGVSGLVVWGLWGRNLGSGDGI